MNSKKILIGIVVAALAFVGGKLILSWRAKEAGLQRARAAVANIKEDILALKPLYPELVEFPGREIEDSYRSVLKRKTRLGFEYRRGPMEKPPRTKGQPYKTRIMLIFSTDLRRQRTRAVELKDISLEYRRVIKCSDKELEAKVKDVFKKHLKPVLELDRKGRGLEL